MKAMTLVSLFIFSSILSSRSLAAISAKESAVTPSVILHQAGSIHGGEAREVVSLLKVKHLIAKNKRLERIEFIMGNAGQFLLQGKPGYFNMELKPGKKQIVIGFAQTLNAKFEERDLRKIFAASPFVKSSEMYFEPQSQSMNFVLNLNRPASVRIMPISGQAQQTARVVMDLFEEKR